MTTNRKSEIENPKYASGVGVGSSVGVRIKGDVGMRGGVGASVGVRVRVLGGGTRLPASEPISGNAMHRMMTSAMTAIMSRRWGASDFIRP